MNSKSPPLRTHPPGYAPDRLPANPAPRAQAHHIPTAAPAPHPSHRALLALPAQPVWVASARRFASTLFALWRLSVDERDCAVLIVGELAANAARHGRSDMTLHLALDPDMLHIAVSDCGDPGLSTPWTEDDPDEHGRGMDIVTTLATWVEILQDDSGRHVRAGLRVLQRRISGAAAPGPTEGHRV